MRYGLAITLLFGLWCTAGASWAADKDTERLENSAAVLGEIMQIPEKGIPHDLLDKAVCVAIIPSEKKLALGFGGSYGRGAMVCRRDGNGPWGAPSMIHGGRRQRGIRVGRPGHGFRRADYERPGRGKTPARQYQDRRRRFRGGRAGGPQRGGRDGPATPCGNVDLLALARRVCGRFTGRPDVQAG